MQHYSVSQQNSLAVAGLDSVLVPDRPVPAPQVPRTYLAPVRPLPVPPVAVPVPAPAPVAVVVDPLDDQVDDVVVDLRAADPSSADLSTVERRAAGWRSEWRTVHVVDVENLLDGDHESTTAERIEARLEEYRLAVGAGPDDVFYFGANPKLWFDVRLAVGGQRVVGYRGKDGADRALLEVVDGDWVVERFDRICIASGDHAFAPLARTCREAGLVVTVASLPMSVSADLYTAATEHVVLGQDLAAA